MKTLSKPLVTIGVVAAAVAAAAWLLPPGGKTIATGFRVSAVARGSILQTVTATGTLSPLTTVAVGSQVSGTIAKLHVDFNYIVALGQLLAEIDPSTYEAKVAQAEADLDSATATLELKRVNARRASELFAAKLISQADFDEAAAELRQQEAAVRIKEGSLASARLDLDRTKIASPIDGVVISRLVDAGQTVQANFSAPELFSLAEDLRRMQISANVSEADIGGVESGQKVEFTVDAFPNRTFTGAVRQVRANATTSSNVVTYPTIITVENDDLKLLPGMTANVTITTAERKGILRVPNAAIRFTPPAGAEMVEGSPGADAPTPGTPADGAASEAATRTVFVLARSPNAGSVGTGALISRLVRAGITDGAYTELLSGLKDGDLVVTGIAAAGAVSGSETSGETRNPFMPSPPKRDTTKSGGGSPPPPM